MSPRHNSTPSRAVTAWIAFAALAAALAGCRPAPRTIGTTPARFGRETLITEDDIARMSVRTAWDVVRMRAPRLFAGADSTTGQPSHVRIQEPHSVNADETPLLVVDGMQAADLSYLSLIPATEIHAIHILDSSAAEPFYGLRAAGGAIVVETKRGT